MPDLPRLRQAHCLLVFGSFAEHELIANLRRSRCVSYCLLGAHEYYRRHNIPSDLKISTTESPPSSFSTAETPYNSNRLPPNAKLVVNQRAAVRSKQTLRNRCSTWLLTRHERPFHDLMCAVHSLS